ncbi:hypothetical protein STW0522RAO56_29140 [Raoultella planticola]|nr:hypothetical protein STW0522RAO56_29140 [Raoultella planticola]
MIRPALALKATIKLTLTPNMIQRDVWTDLIHDHFGLFLAVSTETHTYKTS